MRKRSSFLLALLVVSVRLAAAAPPETVPESQIPAYKRIAPGLATAGQPTAEALARLSEMGFRTVVNLRTAAEGAEAEREVVEKQGLRYVSVPVTPDSFAMADAEAVQKVLDDPAAAPVLLHCHSSNRVGAVYAVIQSRKGQSLDQALAAGEAAGLASPVMRNAVRRVLGAPAEPAAPPVKP